MNTEQKTDQQIDYGMEELIPVVAELTEKFTSAESSSVSYERATLDGGSASQEEEPYEVLEELVCSQTAEELKKQCRKIIDSSTDCMER